MRPLFVLLVTLGFSWVVSAQVSEPASEEVSVDQGDVVESRDELSVGSDQVEESAAKEPLAQPLQKPKKQTTAPEEPVQDDRWRFAVGLGYIVTAHGAAFDSIYYSDGSSSGIGTAELEYEATYSLLLEARYLPKRSWGFTGGLNYEGERKFDKGSLTINGTKVILTGGSGASSLQQTTLYANAVYRWGWFYLPFGVNATQLTFTPAEGFDGSYDEAGMMGAQLGAGFVVDDHFALELTSWVTTMELTTLDGTESLDYGEGILPSLYLFAKYVF